MKKIAFLIISYIFALPMYADINIAKANAEILMSSFKKNNYEFREFNEEYSGKLGKGESEYITLNLFKGLEYILIVGCSNEAKKVNLTVYDENWEEIAKTPEKSNVSLEIKPKTTGVYYIKIDMIETTGKGSDWALFLGYRNNKVK